MNKVMLGDVITFTLGKNSTRIKEPEHQIYSLEDFEGDLQATEERSSNYGCTINVIKSKASPLSEKTVNKVLNSSYVRCDFDPDVLDPWYLCYQINEGAEIEQQINMCNQGTWTSVKKINVGMISQMTIKLPDIKKQKVIGELYRQSIIQNNLLMRQAENLKKLNMTLIKKIEED